jgi:primosomal protein N' (replication factor Y) (superfamily II helicase)
LLSNPARPREIGRVSSAQFVRVVPEVSLDKAFDYSVPGELADKIGLGCKVRVPFGSREITGYVVEIPAQSQVARLKPVLDVLGERAFIPPSLIDLAQWIATYYCSPLAVALRGVLPEAVRRAEAGFKQRLWVEPCRGLDAESVSAQLKKTKSQKLAWESLMEDGGSWLTEVCHRTRTTAAAWHSLAQKGFVTIAPATQERDPFAHDPVNPTTPLVLNDEQLAALAVVAEEMRSDKPRVILLHGVTGSGKTEVYLQGISKTLAEGKTALVLVPEIALTPQTVERFRARFVGQSIGIAVLHSHLSQGERHDQWQQIRTGRARIVIGARSAVFAPLENLGLIVVDEEHENSYKQEESPHYHARDVAIMRGHLEKTAVLLGSATPSLESWHHAQEGKYRLCSLTRRVEVQNMPTMHVLDLRAEFKRNKKPALISDRLVEAIHHRLAARQQVIIFLNRRGYASSLQCPQCGHVENCPRCSVSLTYHRMVGRLRCHLCDYSAPVPHACPECHFDNYKQKGSGTEKVEQALTELFPQARIVRMDSDSMRAKNAYRETLTRFGEGKIDMLVGTQMIAKGLHFPNVTCVGVVHADLALQLPDFRASERVFQVLMQVAGRSGRGATHGEVYVQTNTPFHPAIQFARHHDYTGFTEQELEFRRSLNYPPYCRAVLLTYRGRSEEKTLYVAEQNAKQIAKLLDEEAQATGPAPAPIAKINEQFRYHLFIRTQKLPALMRKMRPLMLEAKWPEGVKVTVDVDPLALL